MTDPYGISRDDAAAIELGTRARDELQTESTIEISALLRERFQGARFSFGPNVPTRADRRVVDGWIRATGWGTVYACTGCVHGEHAANCAGTG